ncbi:MAG: PaaI family thioesterase [Acidovorax sp.]|uniref:PaaI family thioesterase n=1 Tax=Acidovorax sp. TaxID=1872122 RepID=UPI0025C2788E|nr:PaaI family thioesterase [Acidovorax sp.]MCE1194493.1 PaaI family thioesterase [Acidovorax sp.]
MTGAETHAAAPGGAPAVPAGFERLTLGGPFIQNNGPLYVRREGSAVQFGFRVEQRHVNTLGNLHGGMMATFCDMLLPLSVHYKTTELAGRFLPTVSLQVDYLAPAHVGMWVQGEAAPLRITRSLVFAQGLVTADGEACARVSGVFKIGPATPPGAGD